MSDVNSAVPGSWYVAARGYGDASYASDYWDVWAGWGVSASASVYVDSAEYVLEAASPYVVASEGSAYVESAAVAASDGSC